jgi:hypothetical protein
MQWVMNAHPHSMFVRVNAGDDARNHLRVFLFFTRRGTIFTVTSDVEI